MCYHLLLVILFFMLKLSQGKLIDDVPYYLLYTECLCPLQIHMLKPNPQCDGIRR